MVSFTLNGKNVATEKNSTLLNFLREDCRLLSVKNGCSQGACGTCMVLIDGVATKACIKRLAQLDGKSVITLEGLSTHERSVYSQSFAGEGAVQCGFCTPGMVISAKALLDTCPNPTREQIRDALKNNICRCTGYKKIEKAILQAAKTFRNHNAGENLGFYRIDAVSKTLGEAEYCDDIYIENMLIGGAVRSPSARAKIISVDTGEAKSLEGVVLCITADDLPAVKKIGHLKKDWDILIGVGEETHTIGDAIVLLACENSDILTEAKKRIKIEYEELQPITCPKEAMATEAIHIHPGGNLLSHEHLVRGNADKKIKESAFCVTEHYSLPFTEHAFLEPETAVCIPDDIDSGEKVSSVTVYSGDQGIYQTQKECAEALGLDIENVRVIAKTVGGGFGGKEDMSVQHHCAVLAYLSARPVKMSLSRRESLMVHPKRHAMEIDMTTSCDKNGKLTAMKAHIIADTGAYASLGGPVLQRACTHAAGPYNYHDIDIIGEAWYTNNPPAGAFRGFGVTQSCFAIEQNLNRLAEKVGISAWEIRRRNAIQCGQSLPNGQIADENTALAETLDAVKLYCEEHPKAGIACAFKNSGIGVGLPDVGRCLLIVQNGKIHAYSSAACIGQGMGTVIVQMICKTAEIDAGLIVYEMPDSAKSPNSGNTTASRQTLFTGEAACRAAVKLKIALDKTGDFKSIEEALQKLEGCEFFGEFSGHTDKLGSELEHPVSHVAYSYATHVVDIDEKGLLCKVIAAHDSGTIINQESIEGQIEGGVTMSLGYALTEDFPLEKGIPKAQFGTLGLMRSSQVPDIETVLCCSQSITEKANTGTPGERPLAWGAKGVGEISSIPTPPAVALAWYNYDGIFRTSLPLQQTAYKKDAKKQGV
ncbi:MAG: selenium-dependent xanthine dehydrogenase [Spirochaetales bacterium]